MTLPADIQAEEIPLRRDECRRRDFFLRSMNNKIKLQKTTTILGALLCIFSASAAAVGDATTLSDKVAITPGKKFTVQFQKEGDTLKSPKIVKELDSKRPSITMDFSAQGGMNILHIKNGFLQTLRMRCLMRLKGQRTYSETSIAPIPAGLGDFESWREPVEELVLFDFKTSK